MSNTTNIVKNSPGSRPGSSAVFHLISEGGSGAGPAGELVIEVPDGVCGLRLAAGRAPATVPVSSPGAGLLLESVMHDAYPRLLLVNLRSAAIRHNGRVAPHALLLREGDHFGPAGGPTLELALFHRAFVGSPPEVMIGEECPVCRSSFSEETRLYQCAHCGGGLHLEQGAEDEALRCAEMVPECPKCSRPVRLTDGYLTPPALLAEEAC
jgi:hypothetical protein